MTNRQPVEIELKLTLPPHQVEAFLKRMARRRSVPQQQELITRYFDTPDFALSRRGVALRVRRAGRRWLQTLKTEGERRGGLSLRAEYETPVARGKLDWNRFPAEARDYVPEGERALLVPVFETRFRRTAWMVAGQGRAQIEVALDVGVVVSGARSQPICEIELELKSGEPDALFALALDWAGAFECLPLDVSKAERGVRLAHGQEAGPVKSVRAELGAGMSVEQGFAAVVQSCLAQFQANLPGVLASNDFEYVHQARVALRRLRAALRMFRRVCALPQELSDGLNALVRALGPARDWDVLCSETLPGIEPHFGDQAGWSSGMAVLESRRARIRSAMVEDIVRMQPGAWLLAFQRWLLRQGWRDDDGDRDAARQASLKKWARRKLEKGHRPILRGAHDFERLQPGERHALRIAVKRQRYAVEFMQGIGGKRRRARYLAALVALQDGLGRANDARVAWQLVDSMHSELGSMGSFVRGWLAARMNDGGEDDIAKHLKNFMKSLTCW